MDVPEVPINPSNREAPAIQSVPDAKIQAHLPEVDVLLVTTTPVERDALRQALRPLPGETALLRGGTPTLTLGHFGQYGVAHVQCGPGSVGRAASALTVSAAIRAVKPKAVLVLGIAFGVDPDGQCPGDVLVAETVIPYEPMREGDEQKPRGEPLAAGIRLAERFRNRIEDWKELRDGRLVRVFHGKVLSGEKLIDNRAFRDALLGHFPGVVGGEMEGAGAYAAADQEKVEIVLIKSICDFADGFKTDDAQPFASYTAVSLARHVLSQPGALSALGAHDRGLPGERGAVERGNSYPRRRLLAGIDDLPQDWHNRIGDFIDAYIGTAERPNVFCGREADVDRVKGWLDQGDAAPNLLLTAPAGRGKSALLVRLAMHLSARGDIDVVFVPWSLRFETHRPDVFFGCLVARLAHLGGRPAPDLRNATVDMLKRMFLNEVAHPYAEGRKLVVMLDGLDEATGLEVWPGLLPARHSPSIRIVVAVRHQPDDPEGRKWLRALGWENRDVAERMHLPLLEPSDIEATLARLEAPLDRLSQRHDIIAELHRLCVGEPLTLWLMIGEIASLGEDALGLDVSVLRARESGLGAWFDLWWKLQCKQWGDKRPQREPAVRALLDLLAVAEGGLGRADVLSLLPDIIQDGHVLDEALDPLSRLVHGDGKTSGYVPAHPGFGLYLRERLEDVERRRWRARFTAWIEKSAEDLHQERAKPSQMSKYVVLYRAAHLKEDGAAVEQWMSLTTRRWYDAWRAHEEGPSGFLDGVERAWEAIATSGGCLAEEAQCALVRGSIGSTLAHVTPELLKLLLEDGLWGPEQAFAYLREAPALQDAQANRGKLVGVLAPRIPGSLLPALFDVACGLEEIPAGQVDGRVLEDLMGRMARLHATEARIALERIKSPGHRAIRLVELARHLPEEKRPLLLDEALSLARRAERPENRAYVLERVAAALPQPERSDVLSESLSASCEITDMNSRCAMLIALVAVLPTELQARAVAEALAAAARLQENLRRSYLERIFEQSPEPWREQALQALEADIRASEDLHFGALSCLRALLHLPVARHAHWLDLAFELIHRSPDETTRMRATMSLLEEEEVPADASELRRDIAERAMHVAQGLEELWPRVHLLHHLRGLISAERRWLAVVPIWPALVGALRTDHWDDYDYRLEGLMHLAPLDMALDAAREAKFAWVRATLLTTLARRVTGDKRAGMLDEVLDALKSVVTPRKREQILWSALSVAPPERQDILFQQLVEAIDEIRDPYLACHSYMGLARACDEPFRSEVLDAAREVVREERKSHVRFELLRALARHESGARREAILDEARAVAEEETHAWLRRNHLVELAESAEGQLRRNLIEEALRAARDVADQAARVNAMLAYSTHLPSEEVDALVVCIDAIPSPEEKAHAYLALLTRCPGQREKQLEHALAAARPIDHASILHTRASFLARFLEVAPPAARPSLVDEILATARDDLASVERLSVMAKLEEQYPQQSHSSIDIGTASALVSAASHLPVERIPEALAVAAGIEDLAHRARATVSLAQRLGEAERVELAEMLLSTELPLQPHVDMTAKRAETANLVALLLPEPRRSELLERYGDGAGSQLPLSFLFLPQATLLDRVDALLTSDDASGSSQQIQWLLANLPPERRIPVVDHLLDRLTTLEPRIALQILPYVPEPWIDRCLERVVLNGNVGLDIFPKIASRLDARQLDVALDLIIANQSSGSPRDERLEALAAVAAERLRRLDPPRAKLQKLLHDTLRTRAETRAEVLLVLSAMAPLVMALGGTDAAIGVVRAIRRVGEWWP